MCLCVSPDDVAPEIPKSEIRLVGFSPRSREKASFEISFLPIHHPNLILE